MVTRIDPIGGLSPARVVEKPGQVAPKKDGNGPSFAEVLNQSIAEEGDLRVSHHAQERLQQRNIQLTGEEFGKIEKAVQTAKEKGARDSLVLLDNLAFIVSVKNNVIVTAMDRDDQAQRVFTNIDSVVLA